MTSQSSFLEKAQKISRTQSEIVSAVMKLRQYYKAGLLGGERMPEASNPGLEVSSRDNFHYFTLPMSLNYRRSSYQLWQGALATYQDPETRFVFMPELVVKVSDIDLRGALRKHKVALLPVQHTRTWKTICETLVEYYDADIRNLFHSSDNDVILVLEEIQKKRKKHFPHLSGIKIANYWLYVILQYAEPNLKNKRALSIAPDTHVMKASIVLGLVDEMEDRGKLAPLVAAAWAELFSEPTSHSARSKVVQAWRDLIVTENLCPIDMHYPLWLWSRNNFKPPVYNRTRSWLDSSVKGIREIS